MIKGLRKALKREPTEKMLRVVNYIDLTLRPPDSELPDRKDFESCSAFIDKYLEESIERGRKLRLERDFERTVKDECGGYSSWQWGQNDCFDACDFM